MTQEQKSYADAVVKADHPGGWWVTCDWNCRKYLGEISGFYRLDRGMLFLRVRFANGKPWPFDPEVSWVTPLERSY